MDIEIKSISISGNGETQRVTCIVDGKDLEITTPVISEDGLLKEHIKGRMGDVVAKVKEAEDAIRKEVGKVLATDDAARNPDGTAYVGTGTGEGAFSTVYPDPPAETEESKEAASETEDPPADQGDEGTAEQEETTGAEQPEATETEGGESQDA